MENIKKTIEHLYKDLGQNISDDAQIFETIIETKHQNPELSETVQSLYRDIKGWCRSYISSKLENDYGYDIYEHRKIIEKIEDKYLSARQNLSLMRYVKFILSKYNDEGLWLDREIIRCKLSILRHENYIKYLILLSSSTKWKCIITIFLFFIVELVTLLPAPLDRMELFDLQMVHYSDQLAINYISNVLALKVDWIEGPKLVCQNWGGVLLCGIWMVVYIVFVVNILFNNIFSNISEYDEE